MLIAQLLTDCINRQNDAHIKLCAISLDIAELENDVQFARYSISQIELGIVAGLVGPDNDWKSLGSNDGARKHAIEHAQSTNGHLKDAKNGLHQLEIELNERRAEFDNLKRLHAAMSIQQSTLAALLQTLGNIDLPDLSTVNDAESPTEMDFTNLGI